MKLKKFIETHGGWLSVANALEVHPKTLLRWVERDGFPLKKGRMIKRKFGIEVYNGHDAKGLDLLQDTIYLGLNLKEIARILNVAHGTLERWIDEGRIPEKKAIKLDEIILKHSRKRY